MNNKLNCCAYNIAKPQKPAAFTFKGAHAILDKNRKGIAKLRKRGFSWSQIHDCLLRVGVAVNYNNLYQWQLSRFRQRK